MWQAYHTGPGREAGRLRVALSGADDQLRLALTELKQLREVGHSRQCSPCHPPQLKHRRMGTGSRRVVLT